MLLTVNKCLLSSCRIRRINIISLPFDTNALKFNRLEYNSLLVYNRDFLLVQRSSFHSTTKVTAPKPKKANKSSINDKDEAVEVNLPNLTDIETNMKSRISRLEEELKLLRAGKTSVDMFAHIKVDAYGTFIPLSQAGQVTLQSPTKAIVGCFDKDLVNAVAEAIRSCGMNLNPSTEGSNVLITIPKPSKESRDLLTKAASKTAEKVQNVLY